VLIYFKKIHNSFGTQVFKFFHTHVVNQTKFIVSLSNHSGEITYNLFAWKQNLFTSADDERRQLMKAIHE